MPRHQRDIAADFDRYFGNQSVLANWQRLCHDVRIEGADGLRSIRACREALSKVHVNIYELVDANLAGTPVRLFATRAELIRWTVSHKRYFPLKKAKEGGPVRGLLVKIRG
ncbi:hypothetical protein DSL72_005369 [Monilinia vaccinii-corymbosi]|uniref:Uncharacterized protein n=1 Tax=Monilinia vaccinii-corymbosi TaxID=61207 RepID=A0A8A3PF00_9HELO|nr:hypothetical protein DSL72_005369 [Monilinia vaccinii-corymbosi]